MARPKRKLPRVPTTLTAEQAEWLACGDLLGTKLEAAFPGGIEQAEQTWFAYGDDLIAEWLLEHALGTRPALSLPCQSPRGGPGGARPGSAPGKPGRVLWECAHEHRSGPEAFQCAGEEAGRSGRT